MQKFKDWLAVFGGGMLGGLSRYGLGLVLTGQQGLVATTTVNLLGSFLLAFITFGLAQRLALPTWLILGLGTGFVGAFTTWSTLVLETVTLRAIVWFIGNLTLGLACAGCGWALAQVWARRRHEW